MPSIGALPFFMMPSIEMSEEHFEENSNVNAQFNNFPFPLVRIILHKKFYCMQTNEVCEYSMQSYGIRKLIKSLEFPFISVKIYLETNFIYFKFRHLLFSPFLNPSLVRVFAIFMDSFYLLTVIVKKAEGHDGSSFQRNMVIDTDYIQCDAETRIAKIAESSFSQKALIGIG